MRFDLTRARIRPWRREDAASIARHADDRLVWRNLRDRFPHPYTRADAEAWIAAALTQQPMTHFAIEVNGEAAGAIGFDVQLDVLRRSAEIGFWLGRAHWGRGIMTEAVRAVTEHAFAAHDICRVHAEVFEWNPASMRVLEKAGYIFEARLRKSVTKDGMTIDRMIYAVVREAE